MRFAYVSSDFGIHLFGPQGASVHVRETIDALRRLGHEVRVFAPSVRLGQNDGEDPADLRHVPLEGFAAEAVGLLFAEGPLLPEHLAKELRAVVYAEHLQRVLEPELAGFRPDAIYERYSLFAFAGVELSRRLRVPLLLEVNAPLAAEQARHRMLVLRATAEELERRILRSADALLVVSRALVGYAERLGVSAERVSVLPNGVDAQRFHPGVSGAAVRARHGLDGKRVIGFAGSLKPWHDLDTLVSAVGLLKRGDPSAHLFVVGDGPGLAALRDSGADHLTCAGAVAHAAMPAYLAAMDVVAVPYPSDAATYFSPVKLFEAMAMAKPVVGARLGQVGELVADGRTGLLYAPGDPRDLARKLCAVLDMTDRGAALGQAAREWVVSTRTWDHNARRIVEIARSLAAAPAALVG